MSIVFDLTPLTRRADSKRRWLINGFDLEKRKVIIGALAFFPGLMLAALFWPLVGMWAVIWIVVVELAVFWLVEGTRQRGLQVRNYQSIIDRRNSADGQVFVCGRRVEPTTSQITYVRQASAPVARRALDTDLEDAFGISAQGDRLTGDGWNDNPQQME